MREELYTKWRRGKMGTNKRKDEDEKDRWEGK